MSSSIVLPKITSLTAATEDLHLMSNVLTSIRTAEFRSSVQNVLNELSTAISSITLSAGVSKEYVDEKISSLSTSGASSALQISSFDNVRLLNITLTSDMSAVITALSTVIEAFKH